MWKQAGRDLGWTELVRLAGGALPLASLVNPDDARFVAPKDMPAEICQYCRETDQTVPDSEGAVIRCALESLAMRYRQVFSWLEQLDGQTIDTIHIVGGGTQNKLLNQMAADACNRRVVTGPIEATAIGNVAMQAVSAGAIGSIAEAREVIRRSFDVEEYEPQNPVAWDEAYQRYESIVDG
jgi:rhamnulokinase